MTAQQQGNKTNRLLNLNNVLTGLLTSAVIFLCTIQYKFYNAIMLQPGIDKAQDIQITNIQSGIISLTGLVTDSKKTNDQQDKDIINIEASLPNNKKYKFNP